MPVYLIIEITVKDRELYSQYMERVPAIIETFSKGSWRCLNN